MERKESAARNLRTLSLAPVCRWMVSPMSISKLASSPATLLRESQ